ncbi:MAG TPA: hypothetical protein VNY05_11690 [Candidatus Acidoferrales bacterium]|nr:hypothetical protein [Candidatus Acidoferrales bacterium]
MNWSWHPNWNTGRLLTTSSAPGSPGITSSTLRWDFGQASHLRRANKRLPINFKAALIKNGITRVANGLAEQSTLRLWYTRLSLA